MHRFTALWLLVPALALGAEAETSSTAASAAALAPQHGFYVGGAVGTGFLTFSGSTLFAPTVAVQPELRLGLQTPKFGAGATLGLGLNAAIPGGLFPTLFMGGHGDVFLKDLGASRLYGTGQLGFAMVFGTAGGVFPGFGLDLGAGLQTPLLSKLGVGLEGGLRMRFFFNSGRAEPVVGLGFTVTGLYFPQMPVLPTTVAREPGEPKTPPTPPPGDDPRDLPLPPTVYGHTEKKPCSTWITDGWLEPAQSVWQDDPSFADKPTKQLTRLSPFQPRYLAELNLVKGKPTLVFGVHHYLLDGAPVVVDSRDAIVFSGMTTCPEKKPVKAEFTLANGGPARVIGTTETFYTVPLEGEALPQPVPWSASLPAREGQPAGAPFTLEFPGGYTLRAELLKSDGTHTGLAVSAGGTVQESTAPVVTFVPVMLHLLDEAAETELKAKAEALEQATAAHTPDLFPLKPHGLPTRTVTLRNFSEKEIPAKWFESRRVDATVAALNESLAASAFLSGSGRVVAVMPKDDFVGIFGKGAAGMTVDSAVKVKNPAKETVSLSWKVMLVPSSETWDTVAHEILHTLPDGWAGDEMLAECGIDYHNKDDGIAHGVQLTTQGAPMAPERYAGAVPIMGPVTSKAIWVTQCSYWHAVKQFFGPPADPPVIVVRAFFGKEGKGFKGELHPSYTVMGEQDLRPGKGPWAFVLKNAQGAELGRFPFNPRFVDPHTKQERTVRSFVGRIPELPGWAAIELWSPSGLLDTRKLAGDAPVLTLDEPKDQTALTAGQSQVKLAWSATTAPGSTALVSVYSSEDQGRTWTERVFEKSDKELTVPVSPTAKAQLLKVLVTDGLRSSEAFVRLKR
ncbi:MAG: hypothetical protein K1X89_21495 [Myxococcaceae bacterium]|nr:hypothetical protein [Myxococcaceae bacterium]